MFGWLSKRKRAAQPGSHDYARKLLAESWEAYRFARRDRKREAYQPHAYSGDTAILGSHGLLHRRSRDLVRNTAQGKRIVEALTDLVVGTGVRTYSWPFGPNEMFEIVTELESMEQGEFGPRLQFALESDDLFEEWSNDPKQFDIEGRLSWPEMQRMMLAEAATVGNALLVRVFRRDFELVPLAYQLIEREQLDESVDRPASRGNNKIVGGIEFDGQNRAVAYHLFVDHPHEFFGASQTALVGAGAQFSTGQRRQRLSADRVIDLALYHRPSASLGVSWFDASGDSIDDRWRYVDSEIRSAAIDAAFAFVAHLKDAEKNAGVGIADGTDDTDSYDNPEYKVGYSPVASVLGTDESLEMVRQTRPNSGGAGFIQMLDRDIAAAQGLSYFSLTGDYAGANFSSSRAAKLDEDLHIAPLQDWFGVRVALPVRQQFNQLAVAGGRFRSLRPAEFARNRRLYQRFDAIGNGRALLDPFKEGEARTARLRTGLSTYKEECARRGQHWIRILMQLALERRVMGVFGVTPDFTKSGTGSPQQSEADSQADQIADRVAMLLDDD